MVSVVVQKVNHTVADHVRPRGRTGNPARLERVDRLDCRAMDTAAGDGPHSRHVRDRAVTVGVGALLTLGVIIVGWLYLVPPIPSDHLNYLDAARDFPVDPGENAPQHQFLRIGLTLPMRAAMLLFGYSQAAYYVVPLLASVALVLAVYALGTMKFSRAVGVAAAVLTVGNTIVFVDLTAPLPDLLATALFSWAAVIAVAIRGHRWGLGDGRRERIALLVVGALLGWSYLAREYIVFIWPLIALALLGVRGPAAWSWAGLREVGRTVAGRLPRLLWVAIPLVVIGLGETVLNAVVFGDPLARFTTAAGHGDVLAEGINGEEYQGHLRRWYLSRIWWILYGTPEGVWLVGAIIALGVGALVAFRRLWFLAAWAVLFYVPLVLLGGVLSPTMTMLRLVKERYWYPAFPALFLGAIAVVWLMTRAAVRFIPFLGGKAGAIAGLVALAVGIIPVGIAHAERRDDISYRVNGATQMEQLRGWLERNGADVDVIRADRRSVRIVNIFASGPFGGKVWDGETIGWYPELPPRPGDYALFYSVDSPVCGLCDNDVHALFGGATPSAPSAWELVFATDDGVIELYLVR